MKLYFDCKEFKDNLVENKPLLGGTQYLFRFPNNYGASVVKHMGSYGNELDLWELAVVKYNSENDRDWHIDYSTEITDDVIGHMTDEEVLEILADIRDLS